MTVSPRLHILAVGDELLLGRTQDTNTAWLARWASDHGFVVSGAGLIGDDQDELEAAMRTAAAAADLVLVTGGLGPTEDDRTRHALANVCGVELREDRRCLRAIEKTWERVRPGQKVPLSNRRQALIPVGGTSLANDRGTAPGLLCVPSGLAPIACFPGVPHEMKAMVERFADHTTVLFPKLRPPHIAELHLTGLGESRLQDLIGDLAKGTTPKVGITAHEVGHITLRIVGSRSAVTKRCAALRRLIRPYLIPEPSLAASLVAHLAKRDATVTTIESCTCGRLAAALGAVPGVSSVLNQAVVTYADDAKAALVDVPRADLKRAGAVSEVVAAAMARGGLVRSKATLALATTGIAGPDGGTRSKPVGTVWIAAAWGDRVVTRLLQLKGTRTRIQDRAAAEALRLGWELVTDRIKIDAP